MTPRKRASATRPATVSLSVEVGGACVSVDRVPWGDAESVLVELVALTDRVRAQCPSLRSVVEVVPGGAPVDVSEWDEPAGRRRAVGF